MADDYGSSFEFDPSSFGTGAMPPELQPNALTLSPDIANTLQQDQFYPSGNLTDAASTDYAGQRANYNPLTLPFSRAATASSIPSVNPYAAPAETPAVSTSDQPPSYPPWGGPPPYIKDASGKTIDNPEYQGQGSGRVGNWTWDNQQNAWKQVADAANPLAPSTASAQQAPVHPTNFDLAMGDSIAVMQMTNRQNPAMSNNRIWGGEAPQYNSKNVLPFDQIPNSIWHTGAVGDPPSRIQDRVNWLLQQNPDYFKNVRNMYLTIGSNNPSQLDAIKGTLATLKQANPDMHVVVPGMGPGVPDSAVMNKALQSAVEGAGYTFFQPNIRWASDGVHPANSGAMFDQANQALSAARPTPSAGPAAPAPAQPGAPSSLQPGGAATAAPPNALAPGMPGAPMGVPPAAPSRGPGVAPEGTPYTFGDAIKRFEGPSLTVYNDIGGGKPTIGYGHTILPGEEKYASGITAEQQEQIFQKDLQQSLEGVKNKGIDISKLNDNQKEALASYYYNTGTLPHGIEEKIAAGDMQGAADMIRNGIKTGKGVGYLKQLDDRRNAEADMFMLPEGQHINVAAIGRGGGYTSGQRVPGTGQAVGGAMAGVGQPPSQTLTTPFVASNPFAPRPPGAGPATDLQQLNDRDRLAKMMELMRMWSVFGGLNKGIKFTPVSYDPFKVQKASEAARGEPIPAMQTPQPIRSTVERQQLPVTNLGGDIGGISRGGSVLQAGNLRRGIAGI